MNFHENAVDSRRDRAASEDGSESAITTSGAPKSSRSLDRVSGIKDDGDSLLTHPWEGAHVSNKVVVSKRGATFGDGELVAVEMTELFENG